MSDNGTFAGLTMPVFTAFGWAGQENAIKFALTQLEQFIESLHASLSPEGKAVFPHYGINLEASAAYLAGKRETEKGVYVVFYARPLTFEMSFSVQDKAVLNRGLRAGEKNPDHWQKRIYTLGDNWSLHIQQNMIDEESGEISFYQDLYKEPVTNFDAETAQTLTSRAAFLNSEVKWVTPLYLSYKIPSDQVAEMKGKVIGYFSEKVDELLPIIDYFTRNGTVKKSKKRKSTRKSTSTPARARKEKVNTAGSDGFTYIAELKPLHIRKGFINLTSGHWPFFAASARSELRDITVRFNGQSDENCAVWRLQPHDMARIVLSDAVHRWLEQEFSSETNIKVEAARLPNEEIEVKLSAPTAEPA